MSETKKYTDAEIAQAITNVAVDSVSGMTTASAEMYQLVYELELHSEIAEKCQQILAEMLCTPRACICGKCA